MSNTITTAEARRLFGRLRTALLDLDGILTDIIDHKAWEPLGYENLADAWKNELSGVEFNAMNQAAVAYALLDTGSTTPEVAAAIHGVGPEKAQGLAAAYKTGIPVKDAAKAAPRMIGCTRVRSHDRKPATKRNAIKVDGFTDEELTAWKDYAEEKDIDFNEMIRTAIRSGIAFRYRIKTNA